MPIITKRKALDHNQKNKHKRPKKQQQQQLVEFYIETHLPVVAEFVQSQLGWTITKHLVRAQLGKLVARAFRTQFGLSPDRALMPYTGRGKLEMREFYVYARKHEKWYTATLTTGVAMLREKYPAAFLRSQPQIKKMT